MLILTIYKEYFDNIRLGLKTIEHRKNNKYYRNRIMDDHGILKHDTIKFINGYGKHRPWIITELKDVIEDHAYFHLYLGKILEMGNIKNAY